MPSPSSPHTISIHPAFGNNPFRHAAFLYLQHRFPQLAKKYKSTGLASVGDVLVVVEFHHFDNKMNKNNAKYEPYERCKEVEHNTNEINNHNNNNNNNKSGHNNNNKKNNKQYKKSNKNKKKNKSGHHHNHHNHNNHHNNKKNKTINNTFSAVFLASFDPFKSLYILNQITTEISDKYLINNMKSIKHRMITIKGLHLPFSPEKIQSKWKMIPLNLPYFNHVPFPQFIYPNSLQDEPNEDIIRLVYQLNSHTYVQSFNVGIMSVWPQAVVKFVIYQPITIITIDDQDENIKAEINQISPCIVEIPCNNYSMDSNDNILVCHTGIITTHKLDNHNKFYSLIWFILCKVFGLTMLNKILGLDGNDLIANLSTLNVRFTYLDSKTLTKKPDNNVSRNKHNSVHNATNNNTNNTNRIEYDLVHNSAHIAVHNALRIEYDPAHNHTDDESNYTKINHHNKLNDAHNHTDDESKKAHNPPHTELIFDERIQESTLIITRALFSKYKKCAVWLKKIEEMSVIRQKTSLVIIWKSFVQELTNDITNYLQSHTSAHSPSTALWYSMRSNLNQWEQRFRLFPPVSNCLDLLKKFCLRRSLYNFISNDPENWRCVKFNEFMFPTIICRNDLILSQNELYLFNSYNRKNNKDEHESDDNNDNNDDNNNDNNNNDDYNDNNDDNNNNLQSFEVVSLQKYPISKFDIIQDIYGNFNTVQAICFLNPYTPVITAYKHHNGQLTSLIQEDVCKIIKGSGRLCANTKCSKRLPKRSLRCSGCYLVAYCSRKCAKIGWKYHHRHICSKIEQKFGDLKRLWSNGEEEEEKEEEDEEFDSENERNESNE